MIGVSDSARMMRTTSAPSRPRHGQVEQHDIDRIGAESAHRLVAVVGRDDAVAGLAQYGSERADPRRLVIDDEQRQRPLIRRSRFAHRSSSTQ